jgi:methionine sulfoxide reductase heme-binding subunit
MTTQTLWYLTRSTGIVALVLLTATMVLGVLTSGRIVTEQWPGFTWQDLHRRLSLLAVIFLGFHIATTVADGYVPVGWVSAIVPFTSPYRRLWLGLGTLAVDVLLAVGISSLLRSRIRASSWRALHWLAYLCWPLAVAHGLGIGTDAGTEWVLVVVAVCVASVVGSVAWRLRPVRPARVGP